MRIHAAAVVLLSLGLLSAGGCASSSSGPRHQTRWQMTVAPNQPVEFDHNTVLSVDEKTFFGWADRYDVLAGPTPGSDAKARIVFANSSASVDIYTGFGYFLGTHPQVSTKRVIAAAEGTEMIVQAGAEIDRVILLDSSTITVTSRRQPPAGSPVTEAQYQVTLTQTDTFVEAWEDEDTGYYVVSEPRPVDSDPEVKAFVDEVLNAAAGEGFIVQ